MHWTSMASDYATRLIDAQAKLEDLREHIVFLKLQIKQEKKQAKWAKESPTIKDLRAKYPHLRVDNGAGMTYLGLDVGVLEAFDAPVGWERYDSRPQNSSLGSPIVEIYRLRHCPAQLYVTKHVR